MWKTVQAREGCEEHARGFVGGQKEKNMNDTWLMDPVCASVERNSVLLSVFISLFANRISYILKSLLELAWVRC